MNNQYSELYEKFSRLQWLMQRKHTQSHSSRGPMADQTRGQGRVIKMLKMQPEISTRDLAYLLGIRQQSLSELLNKLEKAGYVTRTPSETDKRVMIVTLTEKGEADLPADSASSDIFDCLSPDEQAAFGEYLDRVISTLMAQLGTDEDENEWIDSARRRMGDEKLERLMSMRGGERGQRGQRGGGYGDGNGRRDGYREEGRGGHSSRHDHKDAGGRHQEKYDTEPENE